MLENLVHKIFHLFTKMKYINCQNTYINSISEFVKITIQLQNIPTIYLFSIEYFLTKIPLLCKISPTLQNQSGNFALLSAYKPYIRTSLTLWYTSSIFYFIVLLLFGLNVPKHSRISRQNKQCIFNCIYNQHTIYFSIIDVYHAQQLGTNYCEIILQKLLFTSTRSATLYFKIIGCVEFS